MTADDVHEWLTAAEAAVELGVDPKSVKKRAATGNGLVGRQVGGRNEWQVTRESLDALIESKIMALGPRARPPATTPVPATEPAPSASALDHVVRELQAAEDRVTAARIAELETTVLKLTGERDAARLDAERLRAALVALAGGRLVSDDAH